MLKMFPIRKLKQTYDVQECKNSTTVSSSCKKGV